MRREPFSDRLTEFDRRAWSQTRSGHMRYGLSSEVPVDLCRSTSDVSLGPEDRSENVGEVLEQGGLALGADDRLDGLAVLEQDHRRDRHDLEVAGRRRVGVDVELGDGELVAVARRRSPRGPGRPSCTGRTRWPRSRRGRACRLPRTSCLNEASVTVMVFDIVFSSRIWVRDGTWSDRVERADRRRRRRGRRGVERVAGDVAVVGEPALGVDRCGAAGAGGGDGLPVGVVDEVAGGEDAGRSRSRWSATHLDVAGVVEIDLALDELAARVVADRRRTCR